MGEMMKTNNKAIIKKSSSRRSFLKKAALATGATALGVSGLSAPAITAERKEITMVMTWPENFPGLGTGAARFAKRVTEMSSGRLNVTLYPAGKRVGAFDSFDHVASGKAQIYHGAEYYWTAKDPAFAFFCTVPFGLTYVEMNAWIRWGGGQQLWDELAGKYDLKSFMCGNTGVQAGGWFRKEIKSPADFKGLKIRMPGLGGQMMTKLGASVVSLPGGQIYENLVNGNIDATEWVGPFADEFMKFYEATKIMYASGVHEPGSMLSVGINKSWFSGLSKGDQALIEAAASAENDIMMAEFAAKNGDALVRLKKNHGVKVLQYNDRIYDAFGKAANEVYGEVTANSPMAKKVYDSFVKARTDIGTYYQASDVTYLQQRNRVLKLS